MSSVLSSATPSAHQRLAGAQDRRARHLVALVAERHDQAEAHRAASAASGRPRRSARAARRARRPRPARRGHGASSVSAKRRMSSAEPSERSQQVLDRGEVVAVALQLLDQLQPRDVHRAVVAGARADLGRGQQPARLVGADVAHGHAARAGELVDRHRLVGDVGHGAASYAVTCDIERCNIGSWHSTTPAGEVQTHRPPRPPGLLPDARRGPAARADPRHHVELRTAGRRASRRSPRATR